MSVFGHSFGLAHFVPFFPKLGSTDISDVNHFYIFIFKVLFYSYNVAAVDVQVAGWRGAQCPAVSWRSLSQQPRVGVEKGEPGVG